MKAYTNLKQSKKLEEFLPIESADMEFMFLKKDNSIVSNVPFIKDGHEEPDCSYNIIPCWSLAALLNIIPQEIFGGEYIINITEGTNYKWIISYEPQHPDEISSYIDASSDNLIDCCVKIILKLKDRNIL